MQGPKLNNLVSRCADVAAKGERVQAYVIVYQTKDGTLNYHRDGNWATKIGMLDAVRTGIINGCTGGNE